MTRNLLLKREDAWALREVVKPWTVPSVDGHPTEKLQYMVMQFCTRLYEALLHIELEGRGEWNMEVAADDCFVINQYLKAGMWEGADAILVQTWMALHELNQEPALELPGESGTLEEWEVGNAVSEDSPAKATRRRKSARVGGGAELSADEDSGTVPDPEGG